MGCHYERPNYLNHEDNKFPILHREVVVMWKTVLARLDVLDGELPIATIRDNSDKDLLDSIMKDCEDKHKARVLIE